MCKRIFKVSVTHLEPAHIPGVAGILQAVLVALEEEFQEESVDDRKRHVNRLVGDHLQEVKGNYYVVTNNLTPKCTSSSSGGSLAVGFPNSHLAYIFTIIGYLVDMECGWEMQ